MQQHLHVHRHELKYYLSHSDYVYAQSLLEKLMHKDQHQKDDEGYFIRSLYFDDIQNSSVQEKLGGIEFRDKYRIRIYDCNQDWAKLERKRKNNQYVDKTSVTISKEEAYKLTEGDCDFLLQKESTQARALYFDFKQKYLRPVVIVDYHRDVYKMDYNDIRITFDKNLRTSTEHFDIYDKNILTLPLQRDDVIEMEVKFNHVLPPWFQKFFYFESANYLAISKYCHARLHTREYYHC